MLLFFSPPDPPWTPIITVIILIMIMNFPNGSQMVSLICLNSEYTFECLSNRFFSRQEEHTHRFISCFAILPCAVLEKPIAQAINALKIYQTLHYLWIISTGMKERILSESSYKVMSSLSWGLGFLLIKLAHDNKFLTDLNLTRWVQVDANGVTWQVILHRMWKPFSEPD